MIRHTTDRSGSRECLVGFPMTPACRTPPTESSCTGCAIGVQSAAGTARIVLDLQHDWGAATVRSLPAPGAPRRRLWGGGKGARLTSRHLASLLRILVDALARPITDAEDVG
jgi:hypothetical protein